MTLGRCIIAEICELAEPIDAVVPKSRRSPRSGRSRAPGRIAPSYAGVSIRAICWDWNGTLLDDVEICRQVMNRTLVAYCRTLFADVAAYRGSLRFPIREFYADAGLGDDDFIAAAAEQYVGLLAGRTGAAGLHAGAERTIAALTEQGVIQVLHRPL